MTPAEVKAAAYIMQTFIRRAGLDFSRADSNKSESIYLTIYGRQRPYRVRISNHDEPVEVKRNARAAADFHIRHIDQIRSVQTSIDAIVVREQSGSIRRSK